MNMKRWLVAAVTLIFALGTAGAGEVLHGDPTYEQWLSDFGDQTVVTSIDDIDPNVCNLIHNLNACTPEELEEVEIAPITGSMAEGESEGEPEPLFEDGEPHYEVQSYEEAVEQDCGLAAGTVYVTSDGEVGCVIVRDLEDAGEGEKQAQAPIVAPEPEVLPAD